MSDENETFHTITIHNQHIDRLWDGNYILKKRFYLHARDILATFNVILTTFSLSRSTSFCWEMERLCFNYVAHHVSVFFFSSFVCCDEREINVKIVVKWWCVIFIGLLIYQPFSMLRLIDSNDIGFNAMVSIEQKRVFRAEPNISAFIALYSIILIIKIY